MWRAPLCRAQNYALESHANPQSATHKILAVDFQAPAWRNSKTRQQAKETFK
jgi:hypothetical protein